MLTYQVRRRLFRHGPGVQLHLPGSVTIDFFFLPPEPFGEKGVGGHTVTRGRGASTLFDANSGCYKIEQAEWLSPVEVTIEESPVRTLSFKGRHLSIQQDFESLEDLADFILAVQYGLPALLNVSVADPPTVERVSGTISGVPFRWELDGWHMLLRPTTQAEQEQHIGESWLRLSLLNAPAGTRLLAALHYYHVASRLARAGGSPWEFMAEVILNLSKSLEALFPPSATIGSIDAARTGLQSVDFSAKDADRYFIPAIALRNTIDSGHVDFSLFTTDQLTMFHRYSDIALLAFRSLFARLLKRVEDGRHSLAPVSSEDRRPDKNSLRILKRLKTHFGSSDFLVVKFDDGEVAG